MLHEIPRHELVRSRSKARRSQASLSAAPFSCRKMVERACRARTWPVREAHDSTSPDSSKRDTFQAMLRCPRKCRLRPLNTRTGVENSSTVQRSKTQSVQKLWHGLSLKLHKLYPNLGRRLYSWTALSLTCRKTNLARGFWIWRNCRILTWTLVWAQKESSVA